MADNEKSLAQEYKDLNVKINKLKREIESLKTNNQTFGANLDDEINAKE